MPKYRYIAYGSDGKEVKGEIFSSSKEEAVSVLKERGIFLKEIYLSKKKRLTVEKGIGISDIFFNLSAMISAGVLVPEAVKSLSLEADGKTKAILEDIYSNLIKGMSLSSAMETRQDFFPPFLCSMVRAGEESGTLERVLSDLSAFLEKEKEVKDRVKSALIYPVFMIGVAIILIIFIFTFVFPKISLIFIEQKIPLPFITRFFIAFSSVLHNFWYLFILSLVGVFFLMRTYIRRRAINFHKFLYFSTFKAVKDLYISRFCRIFGLLLKGGVPIISALHFSKDVTGNAYIAERVEKIKEDIKEGMKLSDVIDFLPPTYLQIIQTGEKTGGLPEALMKLADMAEKDFRKSVDNLLRILEPSIILFMGVIVGLMVISILLPIFEMNQVIR
ncbi:MAG: type II secretion system F family protein [Proteobacteria bacterium]|nr:type II secretion system F family protein [Pseudomonadota bacterium]